MSRRPRIAAKRAQLWNTELTELWIPLDRTQEMMSALQTFYAAGGAPVLAYQHTGALSCEIYAAGKSEFWMSPSYGTPVIRIDVFWFGLNAGSPATSFCPRFWELLAPFGYRPHWGKYLGPAENYLKNIPGSPSSSSCGAASTQRRSFSRTTGEPRWASTRPPSSGRQDEDDTRRYRTQPRRLGRGTAPSQDRAASA